jgi:hypothetical protein
MGLPKLRTLLLLALLAATGAVVVALTRPEPLPPPPNRIVPDQFVARLATDALGTAPDQETWQRAGEFFRAHGCTAASLQDWARDVYLGDDFDDRHYDAVERTLTLYEGALAREPDTPGLQGTVAALENGATWEDVIDRLLASEEFAARLVPAICAPGSAAYGAVSPSPPPADVPTGGEGFTGDQAALQQALDGTPPGGTLALAPRAVIRLSSPLRIPQGVTLTTSGAPSPERYARMGRLARVAAPGAGADPATVVLAAGARLRNVWVDGGRAWLQTYVRDALTVRVEGDGATVEQTRITNSLGGGSLFVMGPHYGVPCKTAILHDNLVTAYSSGHDDGTWADGISVACAEATIEDNAVVDATDVGIILYRVEGGSQSSRVEGNTVIAAGRSAFAALAVDPIFGGGGQTFSFDGATITDNTLWTGDRAHFDIGLAVGTRAWFGDGADKGTGASFTDNTTGSLAIHTTSPFAVSGMLDATVQGNTLRSLPAAPSRCPAGPIAAVSGGWASGSIQSPKIDVPLSGCIVHGH